MWNVIKNAKNLTSNLTNVLLEGDEDGHTDARDVADEERYRTIHEAGPRPPEYSNGADGGWDVGEQQQQEVSQQQQQRSPTWRTLPPSSVHSGDRPWTPSDNASTVPPSSGAAKGSGRSMANVQSMLNANTLWGHVGSASNMLSKVASHVAGSEQAPAPSRMQQQLEALKAQVVDSAAENEQLAAEMSRLERELAHAQQLLSTDTAGIGDISLLRARMLEEQQARTAAEDRLATVQAKLTQANKDIDSLNGLVAERDTFWIKEMEGERTACREAVDKLAAAEQRLAEAIAVGSSKAASEADAAAKDAGLAVAEVTAKLSLAEASAQAAAQLAETLQAELAESHQQLLSLSSELTCLRQQQHQEEAQQRTPTDRCEGSDAAAAAAAATGGPLATQQDLPALQGTLAELQRQLQATEQDCAAAMAGRADAEGRLAAQQAELQQALADVQRLSAQAQNSDMGGDLAAQVARLAAELAAERDAHAAVVAELEALQQQDEGSAREQLQMLKELMEDLQGFLEAEKAAHAATAAQLKAAEVRAGDLERAEQAAVRELHRAVAAAAVRLEPERALAEEERLQLSAAQRKLLHLEALGEERAAALEALTEREQDTASKLCESNSKLAVLHAELAVARDDLGEAAAAASASTARVHDLEAELRAAQHAAMPSTSQADYATLKEAYAAAEERYCTLAAQHEQLQGVHDGLQQELLRAQAAAEAAATAAAAAEGVQQQACCSVSEAAQADQRDVLRLQAELAAACQTSATAQQAHEELQQELAALQRWTDELGVREAAAAAAEKQHMLRVQQLQEELTVTRDNEQTIRAAHALLTKQHATLQAQYSALQAHADEVETIAATTDRLAAEKQAQELASLRDALDAERDAGSTLRDQLAAMSARLEEAAVGRRHAEEDVAALQRQLVMAAQAAEQDAAAAAAAVTKERDAGQHMCGQLQAELEARQSQLQAMEQRLKLVDNEQLRVTGAVHERDAFWKQELSEQAARHAELEQRHRATAEALAREQAESVRLRRRVDQLLGDVEVQAELAVSLRHELDATQRALEYTQAAAATYDADQEAEREVARLRGELARTQAEGRRLTSLLEQTQRDAATQLAEAQQELGVASNHAEGLTAERAATVAEHDQLRLQIRALQAQLQQQHAPSAEGLAGPGATPGGVQQLLVQAELSGDAGAPDLAAGMLAKLQQEVDELRGALEAAEQERERLRAQLARLKSQMLREQEEDEAKEDAKVQAALQSHLAMEATLRAELEVAVGRLAAESASWEEAMTMKEREVENLQAALGELTYESEAAEKLRLEVRVVGGRLQRVQDELAASQAALAAATAAREAAERATREAAATLESQRQSEQRTAEECAMLRRALDQALAQVALMSNHENNVLVDRRVVAKLLVTFFERRQSKEVLALMARMLQMGEEDQRKVGLLGRRGILSRVAGAPLSLVRGAGGLLGAGSTGGGGGGGHAPDGSDSFADQWVNFLLSQGGEAGGGDSSAGSSIRAANGGAGGTADSFTAGVRSMSAAVAGLGEGSGSRFAAAAPQGFQGRYSNAFDGGAGDDAAAAGRGHWAASHSSSDGPEAGYVAASAERDSFSAGAAPWNSVGGSLLHHYGSFAASPANVNPGGASTSITAEPDGHASRTDSRSSGVYGLIEPGTAAPPNCSRGSHYPGSSGADAYGAAGYGVASSGYAGELWGGGIDGVSYSAASGPAGSATGDGLGGRATAMAGSYGLPGYRYTADSYTSILGSGAGLGHASSPPSGRGYASNVTAAAGLPAAGGGAGGGVSGDAGEVVRGSPPGLLWDRLNSHPAYSAPATPP